jgi:hypothetical protein
VLVTNGRTVERPPYAVIDDLTELPPLLTAVA